MERVSPVSIQQPLVSVIMAVYNAEAYVAESVTSILEQSYTNWELIVVDDGSTDKSVDVLQLFIDPRIRLIRSDTNQGVSHALNRALQEVTGTLIARQDADDVSLPGRLAAQVTFLESHPDTGLLGTHAIQVNERGDPIISMVHPPTENEAIQYGLLFDSPFISSTVMFRRELLNQVQGFTTDRRVWDDYDMWSRLARSTRAANLPVQLLKYRMVATGLTGTTRNAPEMVREQRRRNIRHYVNDMDERSLELLSWIGFRYSKASVSELHRAYRALCRVVQQITQQRSQQRVLLADARGKLMSLHLLNRPDRIMAAMDRFFKVAVLAFSEITKP
jgi:glycosyltransferase involved in cell wall biosynthesis